MLQDLTARLISAQEEERRHLARELHDDLNQRLAALSIEAGKLARRLPAPTDLIREKLGFFEEQIGNLSDAVHRLSHQLHPAVLDDLGLVAALNAECLGFGEREGVPVTFMHRDLPDLSGRDVSLCLFRIAQESLHNIAKHARATEVSVTLTGTENGILLSIRDSGVGFDPEQVRGRGGLGLASMEERVRQVQGVLSVRSQPAEGTEVEVRVPLPRRAA